MAGDPDIRRRVVFGRRRGHKLRPLRRALMRDLLPQIEIDLGPEGAPIAPRSLFSGGTKEVWLEIGFGAGEHLAWQAARRPDVGFIGCEIFHNGVSTLLNQIATENLSNVRIFADDARLLLARLGAGGITRLFLLFPDPWPKKRHQKRRMMAPENITRLADIMADGGEFRFATDHPEYARWTLLHMMAERRFRWLAEGPGDWRERPGDWPETRYESKARKAGRAPMFLRYERLPRGGAAGGIL
jgi:tRNA (guanine-N7-)-methyltransferase